MPVLIVFLINVARLAINVARLANARARVVRIIIVAARLIIAANVDGAIQESFPWAGRRWLRGRSLRRGSHRATNRRQEHDADDEKLG